jgi:hypothetical protein
VTRAAYFNRNALSLLKWPIKTALQRLGLRHPLEIARSLPRVLTPRDIAVRLLGPEARITDESLIERGYANRGIKLYTAVGVHGAARFVAKETDNVLEIERSAHVLTRRTPENAYSAFAAIHGMARGRETVTVYTEFLPRIREVPALTGEAVAGIASTVAQINACFPEVHASPAEDIARAWQRNLTRRVADRPDAGPAPALIDGICEAIIHRVRGMATVMSHNDLYWSNLAATDHAGALVWRVIDLGTCDINIAGADFHHFARSAITDGPERPWHEALQAHYAASTGRNFDDVLCAGFFYAFYRSVDRTLRFARQGLNEKHAAELPLLDRLVDAVRQHVA